MNEILYSAGVALTALVVVSGLALGTGLLLAPDRVRRASSRLNQWRSMRRSTRWLEAPIASEPLLYRHHRIAGSMIIMGAAYTLVIFAASLITGEQLTADKGPVAPVLNTLMILLAIGNGVALVFGLVVFARPSLLRPIETISNQWVSTRQAMRVMEQMNGSVDHYVLAHPKASGLLFIGASLYVGVTILARITNLLG